MLVCSYIRIFVCSHIRIFAYSYPRIFVYLYICILPKLPSALRPETMKPFFDVQIVPCLRLLRSLLFCLQHLLSCEVKGRRNGGQQRWLCVSAVPLCAFDSCWCCVGRGLWASRGCPSLSHNQAQSIFLPSVSCRPSLYVWRRPGVCRDWHGLTMAWSCS